jgi:GNAT superfamily N-acetyltransferase
VSDPPIEIITPSAEDVDATATVLFRASAAAYTGLVPRGSLWTYEETVASCQRLLGNPTAIVLAAVSGNQWLGVSAVLVPDDGTGDAELRRLYVIPDRWGQGLGHRLHDAALQRARRRGAVTAWLTVLEQNNRARRFYERHGWRQAESNSTEEHDGVVLIRYRYALTDATW